MIEEIYNPENKPVDKIMVIFGFNNGSLEDSPFLHGVLVAQNGIYLGECVSLHEDFLPEDLGILEGSKPDLHEKIRKRFPGGYRMVFISYDGVQDNQLLMNCIRKLVRNIQEKGKNNGTGNNCKRETYH